MAGTITLQPAGDDGVATLTLAHPGKLNAIDIVMWRELRTLFERLQALPAAEAPRALVVRGEGGQFASGGDIAEFAGFRFDEAKLRDFHEGIVAPALQAMLDCDVPLLAQLEGSCLGGGLEIAACCDIRIAGAGCRFGAPIARLGFPMAPRELQVVGRIAASPLLREMLLEARLLDAAAALQHGLVHAVVPDDAVADTTRQRAEAIAALAPLAARINKHTLRQIERGGPSEAEHRAHFGYAGHHDHREGVMAFLEKRTPRFQRG